MPEVHRLPRRLRLLSQLIPVRVVENLEHEVGKDDEGKAKYAPAYGLYNERDQVISIDAHLPFERQRETLMHEVLHAMFSAAQIDCMLQDGLDEHVVGTLAPVLLSFMRDNPRAMAYLMEKQP